MNVLLLSTYELGRQPFGLASPAAWLRSEGATVVCQDLAVEELDEVRVAAADLVAFYLPMHTATRLACRLLGRVRRINADAHLCCYGLYAPMNAGYLRRLGVRTILGGEFEEALAALVHRLVLESASTVTHRGRRCAAPARRTTQSARRVCRGKRNASRAEAAPPECDRTYGLEHAACSTGGRVPTSAHEQPEPLVSLARQRFHVPDRAGLPDLKRYARLQTATGEVRTVGYTEASRGCKHLCRHCPVVPVYQGSFRIVQREVVLEDIRRQVAAGARHITFGDPDFFNGPTHAARVVEAVHREFPALTYDVTIKIEHLLQQAHLLPVLRDTGCIFVTSAVEAVDDRILEILDKGHTREDFFEAVALFRRLGLVLNPTFVAFTPWTTIEGYLELLAVLLELDLVEHVAAIQYGIRLLIPRGSRLLELRAVREMVGAFDEERLVFPWRHVDPRVDRLGDAVLDAVHRGQHCGLPRRELFRGVWRLASAAAERDARRGLDLSALDRAPAAATVPYLTEPWYC